MMGEWNEEAIDTIIENLEPEKVEQDPYIPPNHCVATIQIWIQIWRGGGSAWLKSFNILTYFDFEKEGYF